MLTINKNTTQFKYELRVSINAPPKEAILVPNTPRVVVRPRYNKDEWYEIYKHYIKEIISDILGTIYSVHDNNPFIEVIANKKRIKRAILDALYNSSNSSFKHYNFLK